QPGPARPCRRAHGQLGRPGRHASADPRAGHPHVAVDHPAVDHEHAHDDHHHRTGAASVIPVAGPDAPDRTEAGRRGPAWRDHLSFWLIGAAVVGALLVLWSLLSELALLLGLLAVALFFTVVLTPFVD